LVQGPGRKGYLIARDEFSIMREPRAFEIAVATEFDIDGILDVFAVVAAGERYIGASCRPHGKKCGHRFEISRPDTNGFVDLGMLDPARGPSISDLGRSVSKRNFACLFRSCAAKIGRRTWELTKSRLLISAEPHSRTSWRVFGR
jgi:hypothetical protein